MQDTNTSQTDITGEIEIAGKRYATGERLAQILQTSVRTIARWDAARIGPPKIKIGKTVLFDLGKIPDWLADHETQPVRAGRRGGRNA